MARKLKLNMEGVESYTRCPEGEWLAKLTKIEMGEVQGSGDDCLKARFEVIKGSAKGNTVFETFALSEKALWKLKSFLEAIGVKATGKISLDLDKLEGKICIIDVIHDEYNGTKRAKISAYVKPGDDSDDDDEEDEVDDEEEDDDEEEPPKKSSKKSAPAKKSKKKPEPEEDEDEDEDEDDEDEEEEKPAPKSKKSDKKTPAKNTKKTSSKKKSEPEPEEDDDDDEDDDWEEDDD